MESPFVGPRPFGEKNTIYGRDQEISELRYFVGAKRIVLLYSPSGAGKSSLLQASNGLMAKLKETGRFDVWGTARVNQLPQGFAVANRFAWSVINDFAKRPGNDVRPPESLAQTTLASYLKEERGALSPLLVFDQFEEVLRLDPHQTADKRAFFDQLGEALQDPSVWAIFVIREDYLAALTPYARQLPTHLRNQFRIDFLRRADQAVDAIRMPLESIGRSFEANVPAEVATDLALGGDYVEPLQLQVVGTNLWDRIKDRDKAIPVTRADIGEISDALAAYYREKVRRPSRVQERRIRDWFDEKLITPEGVRNLVRQGPEQTAGLPNDVADELLGTYLVRKETRAGSTWFELAHDRLVEPVRRDNRRFRDLTQGAMGDDLGTYYRSKVHQDDPRLERRVREWIASELITPDGRRTQAAQTDNGIPSVIIDSLVGAYLLRTEQRDGTKLIELDHDRFIQPILRDNQSWFEASLTAAQRAAVLWERSGREPGLLLRGQALKDALEWARTNPPTPNERAFFEQSRLAQRAARRQRNLLIAVAVFALAALGASYVAMVKSRDSEQKAKEARDYLAAALANEKRAKSKELEAQRSMVRANAEAQRADSEAKMAKLAQAGQLVSVGIGFEAENVDSAAAFFAQALRTAPESTEARQWAARTLILQDWLVPEAILSHPGNVIQAAFHPDGTRLVTAAADGVVRVWNVLSGRSLFSMQGASPRFRPDGKQLLTVGPDGVQLWDAANGQKIGQPLRTRQGANLAVFTRDSKRLVIAGGIMLDAIDLDSGATAGGTMTDTPVSSLVASPIKREVFATLSSGALLWDVDTGNQNKVASMGPITAVAYNFNGDLVYALGRGGLKAAGVPDPVFPGMVNGVTFVDGGNRLAVASGPNVYLLDRLSGKQLRSNSFGYPSIQVFPAPTGYLAVAAPNAAWLVQPSEPGAGLRNLLLHQGIQGASAAGDRVVTWGADKTARLWRSVSRSPRYRGFPLNDPAGAAATIGDSGVMADLLEAAAGLVVRNGVVELMADDARRKRFESLRTRLPGMDGKTAEEVRRFLSAQSLSSPSRP